MQHRAELGSYLAARGVSRRAFLKYCVGLTALLGLPAATADAFVRALGGERRRPLVWLSFQECTGCTESLTRSSAPTLSSLIFDFYSLDYHHTLQAAAGEAAEAARDAAVRAGGLLLVVDGSVPLAMDGCCSTIAGRTNLDILRECMEAAVAVFAVGTCAAYGGLPRAAPNPTGAVSIEQLIDRGEVASRPLVNIPGCPPIPEAIAATLAHFIVFDRLPQLDELHRPLAIYGSTVHDRCPRVSFFYEGKFAETFDDAGARKGWCLYKLGCKGPVTHNACATLKWNGGVSSPVDAGHPCIGCSEPDFWDQGGFYDPITALPGTQGVITTEAGARGQALYDSNCVYCHEPDGRGLRTPPASIPQAFPGLAGRAHRTQLDADQWADLVQFLEEMSR